MPFQKGHSGNPGGRPANGVTHAIRALEGAPEAVATYVLSVLKDDSAPRSAKQWACEFVANRLDGLPVASTQNVSLSVRGTAPGLPSDWQSLTLEQRRAFVARLKSGDE